VLSAPRVGESPCYLKCICREVWTGGGNQTENQIPFPAMDPLSWSSHLTFWRLELKGERTGQDKHTSSGAPSSLKMAVKVQWHLGGMCECPTQQCLSLAQSPPFFALTVPLTGCPHWVGPDLPKEPCCPLPCCLAAEASSVLCLTPDATCLPPGPGQSLP
jgi:hypothetical protein